MKIATKELKGRQLDWAVATIAGYSDLRGNPWVKDDAPYKDAHTLLLGLNDA